MLGQGKRGNDVDEFYRILDQLGGPRHLKDLAVCPPQGVYFFYEDGENRLDGSRRVVRVGTHALTATSKAALRSRLRQYRGQLTGRNPGGGNHRGFGISSARGCGSHPSRGSAQRTPRLLA